MDVVSLAGFKLLLLKHLATDFIFTSRTSLELTSTEKNKNLLISQSITIQNSLSLPQELVLLVTEVVLHVNEFDALLRTENFKAIIGVEDFVIECVCRSDPEKNI